jgi:hypothetical protein
VLEAGGLRRVAAALEQVGGFRTAGKRRIRPVRVREGTARLVVRVDTGGDEVARYRFDLVRGPEGWAIAYDELTADSLEGWVGIRRGGTAEAKAAGRRFRRTFEAEGERAVRSGGAQ